MHIKALQDRCFASEGMIRQFRKRQEIENKEWAHYSEAILTLNQKLTAKTKALAEETCRFEEVKKVKTNLETKLTSLHEQMEREKADAMAGFKAS